MSTGDLISIFQDTVITAFKLSAPALIISLIVGLVISIIQAATQIHEQTLTFVPKLIVIVVVLLILGSWMIETINDFVVRIFEIIKDIS